MATKKELIYALQEAGFKRIKSWHKTVACFLLTINKKENRYAEVYKYCDSDYEVWIVGQGIPTTGTMSYPGGTRIYDVAKVKELFDKHPVTD